MVLHRKRSAVALTLLSLALALILAALPLISSAAPATATPWGSRAIGTPLDAQQGVLNLPAICYPLKKTFLPLAARNFPAGVRSPAPAAQIVQIAQSPIHAVRVGYNDLSLSRPQVPAMQANLTRVDANFVALSAGRPDWSYFKWVGHETWWSSEVTDDQIDYLAEDIANYGAGRHVNAVVDMFAPRWITAHPMDAAVFFTGTITSTDQVSTAALVNGAYGWQALEMIGYVAAFHHVDSIAITEFFYHNYGYGADDLALYQADTGHADWPRDANDAVDRNDPGLGMWRSQKVAAWLERAAACAHNHDKAFYLDARISWGNLTSESRENGQDYATMLAVADKLILWGFPNLEGYAPGYLQEVASYLSGKYAADRFIMSVGLWGPEGTAVPAADVQTSMQSSVAGGLPDLWITPTNLFTAAHWDVLDVQWP